MTASELLARRFLHVNLNCAALGAAEKLYVEQLGLLPRMRTDPAVATNGSILGLNGEAYCQTVFLYDVRGARAGCALEVIEYHEPATSVDASMDPVRPGIRGTAVAVPDLAATAQLLRDAGLAVGNPTEGLISGAKSILVLDPDGAVIELSQVPAESAGALFNGLRIAAIDIDKTAQFLTAIGFSEIQPPTTVPVTSEQLTPSGSGEHVSCQVARFALAEDGDQFTVTVVGHPDTGGQQPVPWGGNRQGLYRCALRVENLDQALSALPDGLEPVGDAVWCPLPGTKIDGLYIAFLRSPDGVVFEFVERPLEYFGR